MTTLLDTLPGPVATAKRAVPDSGPPSTVVRLFGGPYVDVDGQRREVPEGSKRLLVFVVLRRGRVDRRYAAGALWPTGTEQRAAGNLRSALWRLRCAGIDVLEADKLSLALRADVGVDLLDVTTWAMSLIKGSVAPAELPLDRAWLEALDLLPGWYDDWAIFERERSRQRVLHALEALAGLLVRAGRCAEAVDVAMSAVGVEPLRESAQRALVAAHLAEGNRVEASRCAATYAALLHRELGEDLPADLAVIGSQRCPASATGRA